MSINNIRTKILATIRSERYKKFNGMEGNSPTTNVSNGLNADGYPTQATNAPDIEDINADNNLSESESYFQYRVSLRPNDLQTVGQNYITNTQVYQNGTKTETWYQFKIPIKDFEKRVNGIQDFRSIRFMRMFMKKIRIVCQPRRTSGL
jgi:cell surface protein SprA